MTPRPKSAPPAQKLWGGRFSGRPHPLFDKFGSSISFDYRLLEQDLRASAAHCRMLARVRILTRPAALKIERALNRIAKNLPEHLKTLPSSAYEDVHSFIESELVRRVGPEAKRIHTARSRNDQVNEAVRLYCGDHGKAILRSVDDLERAILDSSEKYLDVILPGMTHLQKAQPVLLAHAWLAHIESLERSRERVSDALERMNRLSLGSGAISGSAIPIDREGMARELGHSGCTRNSLDAVGSRDFVAELVFALTLLSCDLSRMAEDFLLGQMEEMGWFLPPENLCTGSSMMPQKRNPDFLELSRGQTALMIGHSCALLTLLKGLPTSYNRDLQWDKKPLFEAVEMIREILPLWTEFFRGVAVNRKRLQVSLSSDALYATDLAEELVIRGMPFREAHERVGMLVKDCEASGTLLRDADTTAQKRHLGTAFRRWRRFFVPEASVKRKNILGGTAPLRVKKEIQLWRSLLRERSTDRSKKLRKT